jgi:hypothetical protein
VQSREHESSSVEIYHKDSIECDTDWTFVCIGQDIVRRQYAAEDPSRFHEVLCRRAYRQKPVIGTGSGSVAQRILLHGGTLDNGKLVIREQDYHGRRVRHLMAGVLFAPNEIVTCYGGFLQKEPKLSKDKTHMRHIPHTNLVLNGWAFSQSFPLTTGSMQRLGYDVDMIPFHENPDWLRVIRTTGLGYMANTKTSCPMRVNNKTNVTVCQAQLGRDIDGVGYKNMLYLVANGNGIAKGDPIISPYRSYTLKDKFWFPCIDRNHYEAAGQSAKFPVDAEK